MRDRHKIINLKPDTIIGVVGDVHEHEAQFDSIVEQFKPSDKRILISVGDLYDKGFGPQQAESVALKLKELNAHAVVGNHEYKIIRKHLKKDTEMPPGLAWMNSQPWSISVNFPNGKKVLVLHGGVTPNHTASHLSNSEIFYVRTVDEDGNFISLLWKEIDGKRVLVPAKPGGVDWHELYDGRFGYIVAGHAAQKDGIAKYFSHSCNIDTCCYETGKLTCQVFDSKGNLSDRLEAQGEPFGFGADGF